jgi:hypothetical protein
MMPIAQFYAERNGLEIDWRNPAATLSSWTRSLCFDDLIAQYLAGFSLAGHLLSCTSVATPLFCLILQTYAFG